MAHRLQAAAALLLSLVAVAGCGTAGRGSAGGASPPSPRSASPTRTRTHAPLPPRPTASPTSSSSSPIVIGGNRLWVEGDSVLLGTTQTLPAALVGWRVRMDCVGSRRLTEAIPVLLANRSRLGSVVVIQMGNDFIPGEDGTFASQIDRAMRVMSGIRRVVWVTVAEKWPNRIAINAAIRAAASRWPTIRVADWAPIIAAHHSYAYDMLHLTPSGRLAISRLIARFVGPPRP